jgi:TolB-like protein/class 3 adenylate cyclase/lipopolysaccharide biosynthesis regulator YciM
MPEQNRQLAAILFTDIVGYTAMMQKDEENALAVTRHYIAALKQATETFHGRILNDYGDGSLCCFPSVTEAVKAAVQIQQKLQQDPKVPLRIGIHMGELFFEENKVMGDSVNVASRIQSLGQPNTILFSREVFDKLKNQPEYRSVSLGKFEFKNVDEPLEIFALDREGLVVPKREQLSGKLKEIKKKSRRRNIIVVTILLLLVLGALFLSRRFLTPPGFTGEKSVAVLPFENTGTDSSEQYLTDGITQDIINKLSRISSLQKVIAWFSVRSFRKTTQPLKQIADELGVAAILKGSVEKRDNKTYIIAELIEAGTNNRLWGDEFVYDSKDFLSIQSKVSSQIVTALHANISPDDRKKLDKNYTENIEAYKLYRRGRLFWDQRSRESYDSAEANYKRAIDLDPDYALAYAGLADCYTFNQRGISQLDAVPIAETYANKALQLDSTLVEAQTTLAFIQSHVNYDWQGAKSKFENIIKENPNYPIAHLYYSNVLLLTGNADAGLGEIKKALALDPLSLVLNMVLGRAYYFAREYDRAITQLQKTVTINPHFNSAYWHLGNAFLQKKLYTEAIDAYSRMPAGAFDNSLDGMMSLSIAYAVSGDKIRAKIELANITKEDYLRIDPVLVAQFYTSMGNFDEALTHLERGFETHSINMIGLKVDPLLDPIRNTTRFKALVKKMNLE